MESVARPASSFTTDYRARGGVIKNSDWHTLNRHFDNTSLLHQSRSRVTHNRVAVLSGKHEIERLHL